MTRSLRGRRRVRRLYAERARGPVAPSPLGTRTWSASNLAAPASDGRRIARGKRLLEHAVNPLLGFGADREPLSQRCQRGRQLIAAEARHERGKADARGHLARWRTERPSQSDQHRSGGDRRHLPRFSGVSRFVPYRRSPSWGQVERYSPSACSLVSDWFRISAALSPEQERHRVKNRNIGQLSRPLWVAEGCTFGTSGSGRPCSGENGVCLTARGRSRKRCDASDRAWFSFSRQSATWAGRTRVLPALVDWTLRMRRARLSGRLKRRCLLRRCEHRRRLVPVDHVFRIRHHAVLVQVEPFAVRLPPRPAACRSPSPHTSSTTDAASVGEHDRGAADDLRDELRHAAAVEQPLDAD